MNSAIFGKSISKCGPVAGKVSCIRTRVVALYLIWLIYYLRNQFLCSPVEPKADNNYGALYEIVEAVLKEGRDSERWVNNSHEGKVKRRPTI